MIRRTFNRFSGATVAMSMFLLAAAAQADDPGADPHAQHRMMMASSAGVTQSDAHYTVPSNVTLVRADGKTVSALDAIPENEAVIVNFIYTTCTTICPLTSQVFAILQSRLEAHQLKAHLVSISIDPEQDTPAVLTEYAKRFHAGPTWSYYTGTTSASVAVQKAFGVYSGDKMNHLPLTFVRPAKSADWIRIQGFPTADEIAMTLHGMLDKK